MREHELVLTGIEILVAFATVLKKKRKSSPPFCVRQCFNILYIA